MNKIYFGDNLEILKKLSSESIPLIYIDPPFNTGKTQTLVAQKNVKSDNKEILSEMSYNDTFASEDYINDFLKPRLVEAYRILSPTGSLFFHIDYREVHYCKVLLDSIFGRTSFINEIIWAYDYGARSKTRWSAKHDNILWYAKDPKNYTFNYEDMERIPYMAPGLVGPEKAARGKTLTDTWFHTICPTQGPERTGYPTQKPLGILKRIVSIHSKPNDVVLDFFAGSGTTGEAARLLNRQFILIDKNPEALKVMKDRFSKETDIDWIT